MLLLLLFFFKHILIFVTHFFHLNRHLVRSVFVLVFNDFWFNFDLLDYLLTILRLSLIVLNIISVW